MSDLVPSVVPLSAGLSLQVPKLMAPPGSLTSMINYEQVDLQGQKRIDGYARYDGNLLSALDDFLVVNANNLTDEYTAEEGLLLKDGIPVAVILGSGSTYVHIAPLDENNVPLHVAGRDRFSDPEEHYELLLAYMRVLRTRTERLPGAVAGLHWFRDRLYSVADTARIAAVVGAPVYPNDVISVGPYSAKVLNAYPSVDNVVYINISAMEAADWAQSPLPLMRNGEVIGETIPYVASTDTRRLASFYESRTERQAVLEDGTAQADYGWKFVDLGWTLNFRDGLTLYGGLPSLNQNLGAIGSGWSGTGGNTGSPLILTQNINISNDREQVNGWKNSNTPTSYGLSPSNITTLDSAFIYADAYVSWDGETRVITVAKDNLVEYPATATVEVSPE